MSEARIIIEPLEEGLSLGDADFVKVTILAEKEDALTMVDGAIEAVNADINAVKLSY